MGNKTTPEELSLLGKKLQRGDVDAFDQIYRLYSSRLFGFALSILKDHDDAKEIVQETFIRLWNRREELKSGQSIKSYLFTISYNIAIDTIRRRSRDEKYIAYLKLHFSMADFNTEEQVNFNELSAELGKVISSLPEQRQRIFKMSREEGMSHAEIAEELGITAKTVENQINLSLKMLRKKLQAKNLHSFLFLSLFS